MSEQNPNTVWRLLTELSTKKGISEIAINSPKKVFIERDGEFLGLDVALTKEHIVEFAHEVAKYNKKELSTNQPFLDGKLPDGSRINIVLEPIAHFSPAITIRKYIKQITSFDAIPGLFGLTPEWINFLKAAVAARINIIVSGGTGSGKTTFLSLLLNELPPKERIITIEDTLEISCAHGNIVRLEARLANSLTSIKAVEMSDLVKNALRMRPDRIIIGEVRGGEFFDLLQAMNTGHDGSMSSIHASSPKECFSRMENLFLLSGHELPVAALRQQMAAALKLVIQLSRDSSGKRIVSHITEITGVEGSSVLLRQNLAINEEGALRFQGVVPQFMKQLHERGGLPLDFFSKF